MSGLFTRCAPCALLVAFTGQAVAQDSADNIDDAVIEEIIVTAQKREQSVLDVPISVTAYDGNFLDTIGVEQFDQLSDFTPGFLVQQQSPNNPGFVVRGITSDSGEATIEPRVSIFLDGVSASRSRGSVVNLFDIERVEVVKGPQSTLFGRAALIGGVSVITNKADGELSASLEAEGSNFGGYRIEGHANVPILGDRLALRGAFFVQERDGFVTNVAEGEDDLNSTDVTAFRFSLHAEPTERLTADLIFNYQEDTPNGTAFKSGTLPPLGGDTSPFTFADLQTFDDPNGFIFEGDRNLGLEREIWSVTGLVTYELTDAITIDSVTGYREFDSLEIFDADGSSLPATLFAEDAEGIQFSQELRASYDDGGFFSAFVGVSYFHEDGSQRVPSQINEAALQALLPIVLPGSGLPPQLAIGATPPPASSLIPFNVAGLPAALPGLIGAGVLPPEAALNPFDPAFAPILAAIPGLGLGVQAEEFENTGLTNAIDFFADATFRFTDRLELTVGGRFTYEDKESTLRQVALNGPNGFTAAIPGAEALLFSDLALQNGFVAPFLSLPGATIADNEDFTGFSGRVALRYEISEALSSYVNYGRGRRPQVLAPDSGFSVLLGAPPASALAAPPLSLPFPASEEAFVQAANLAGFAGETAADLGAALIEELPAETVDAFEVGLKGRFFNGRLSTELSAYHYIYRNFVTTVTDATTGLPDTINAGNADAQGVELVANALPHDQVELFFTYGFNRARFDDTDGSGNPQALAGNTFRLSPDHSLSAGATFTQPLGFARLEFTPTYVWQSEVFFEDDNSPFVATGADGLPVVLPIAQDARGVLDLRLRLISETAAPVAWEVEMFVDNALNNEFIIDAGNTGLAFGTPTFIRGAPRVFGGGITVRY